MDCDKFEVVHRVDLDRIDCKMYKTIQIGHQDDKVSHHDEIVSEENIQCSCNLLGMDGCAQTAPF